MLDTMQLSRYQRELTAMCRTVGENDPEAFAELVRLAEWLNREGLQIAVDGLRAEGYSWAEIARPLRVTRSAVAQRYGHPAAVEALELLEALEHDHHEVAEVDEVAGGGPRR